jgi:hypothetical protein
MRGQNGCNVRRIANPRLRRQNSSLCVCVCVCVCRKLVCVCMPLCALLELPGLRKRKVKLREH